MDLALPDFIIIRFPPLHAGEYQRITEMGVQVKGLLKRIRHYPPLCNSLGFPRMQSNDYENMGVSPVSR